MIQKLLIAGSLVGLIGCTTTPPNLPSGAAAYESFPAPVANEQYEDYRIGPLDEITVNVFQEEDLSLEKVRVDAAGNLFMPLVGTVKAGGLTPSELSQEISGRLAERYLVDPQVSVQIDTAVSQRVIVEGSVTKPGVFPITGSATLIEAIALAEGPDQLAQISEVVVFRNINGQRHGALFDLGQIRRGEAADPRILGGDTIVVGVSNLKTSWQMIVSTLPALAIFRPF
jgi:polysaccharide export outer membrane protein